MSQKSDGAACSASQRFTEKQGQYLAFIYVYSRMFGQAPAETDIRRHFRTSPPSVHQMIVNLHRAGLISRKPGAPRSIQLLVAPEHIPILKWLGINPS
jgi:DNA-binding MarR family transcriptional regulator